ncbi:MAG: glycosyltransferase family 4 protein [Candidatus Accumulibacter meliphilus]|jgi:glycosyltransferase involved in cell wall biosynthesis|uniref:glycosyltransferase family 4 protein n=1 Tax=Candidatus Accumulibacter meliphilus TaxID=2211374 RepID=UPI002FC27A91
MDDDALQSGMKPLHLVFVAHFAGSPSHGMVYGHYFLAREWVKLGHRVTIVAAGRAHTRFRQPELSGRVTEEMIDGIRYLWVRTPDYAAASRMGRVFNLLSFVGQLLTVRLPVGEVDLVICSSHCPFAIHPARSLARRTGARLIFEVRDLWPLTLVELGNVRPSHPLIRAMQWSEDYAYRHAEKVVSVLAAARDYMVSRGMRADKFHFVPNGVDMSEEMGANPLPSSHSEVLEELRRSGRFLIGYAGRVGVANALHSLIDALARCGDDSVHVVILGDGAYVADLRERTQALGVAGRVTFLASVVKGQVNDFLTYMDTAYIGLQGQPLFRFGVSPTKLNDYMLAARPILYAIDAPGDVVAESGAGVSCKAEDADSIADGIRQLVAAGPEGRKAMGERGHEWIKFNRSYSVLAARFLEAVLPETPVALQESSGGRTR